jgi:hypothetical protein
MGFPQAEHTLGGDRLDVRFVPHWQAYEIENFTHDEAMLVAAEVADGTPLLPVAPDSEEWEVVLRW